MISNEFIQEANLWSQSQKEETFMMTLWSIRNKLPYLFGYLVPTAWNLVDAIIENGIYDYQAKSLYISRNACGHVDVGTCPHQVLAATLTLS
jgi:hypothetical protein